MNSCEQFGIVAAHLTGRDPRIDDSHEEPLALASYATEGLADFGVSTGVGAHRPDELGQRRILSIHIDVPRSSTASSLPMKVSCDDSASWKRP